MQATTRQVFQGADGVALVGDVTGSPHRGTVLLAHGGGQTRHAWSSAASKLALQGWRAVALDLRGHGESEWSPIGDYRMQRFAEDLVVVADQLGERPALVGASLGGLAGLMVETVLAPRTFSSLTLVDITARMEVSGVAKIMGFMGANLQDGFASLDEAADTIASYLPHRPRPTELSGLAKNLRRHADGRYRWHWDPRFVTSVMEGRDEHLMERFESGARNLTLPVHLIRGRMSELVSEEAAKEFIEMVPHATFTNVAGAGHMVAGDRNDAFVVAVLQFLNSNKVSTAHDR
ncbi:MAG: alpha/beta hydrolase [Micropepsaceae bacterium]